MKRVALSLVCLFGSVDVPKGEDGTIRFAGMARNVNKNPLTDHLYQKSGVTSWTKET